MLILSDPKNATTESRSWRNYFKVFLAVSVTALGYYAGKSLGILPWKWVDSTENDVTESTTLSAGTRIENTFLTVETLAVFKDKSLSVDNAEQQLAVKRSNMPINLNVDSMHFTGTVVHLHSSIEWVSTEQSAHTNETDLKTVGGLPRNFF